VSFFDYRRSRSELINLKASIGKPVKRSVENAAGDDSVKIPAWRDRGMRYTSDVGVHCESEKNKTLGLLRRMLTYFQNSFKIRLRSKFVIKSYLNTPSHLKHLPTLPCEIYMFQKSPCSTNN